MWIIATKNNRMGLPHLNPVSIICFTSIVTHFPPVSNLNNLSYNVKIKIHNRMKLIAKSRLLTVSRSGTLERGRLVRIAVRLQQGALRQLWVQRRQLAHAAATRRTARRPVGKRPRHQTGRVRCIVRPETVRAVGERVTGQILQAATWGAFLHARSGGCRSVRPERVCPGGGGAVGKLGSVRG